MNQVYPLIQLIRKLYELPSDKLSTWIGGKGILDYFSGFKINNEEHIEAFVKDGIYGKEICRIKA